MIDALFLTRILLNLMTAMLFLFVYVEKRHLSFLLLSMQATINLILRICIAVNDISPTDTSYTITLVIVNMISLIAAYHFYQSYSGRKGVG